MKHAIFLEEGLVHDEYQRKNEADRKGSGNVRVGPPVRVLRPGQTNTEEDKSSSKQKIAHPVELLELVHGTTTVLLLLLRPRWIVCDETKQRGQEIPSHGHVEVVSEAIGRGIVGTVERTTDQKATNTSEAIGCHVGGLAVSAPSSW